MKEDGKNQGNNQTKETGKRGFFDFIFEKEENNPVPQKQDQPAKVIGIQPAASTISADILIDPQFYEQLKAAVALKGKSYESFTDMLTVLAMIPDEKQRYEAAIGALGKTSGTSKEELIHALEAKVEALKAEGEEFSALLDDKHAAIQGFTSQAQEIDNKIKKLDEERKRLLEEKNGIISNQEELQKKASKAELDFGNAIKKVQEEIQSAKTKIIDFLGGAK